MEKQDISNEHEQRRSSSPINVETEEHKEPFPTAQWWLGRPIKMIRRPPPKSLEQRRRLMTRACSDLAPLISAGLRLQSLHVCCLFYKNNNN